MTYNTKFSIGDSVYTIKKQCPKEWKPCDFCNGSGRIEGANGQNRSCPECYGSGGENVIMKEVYDLNHEGIGIIGKIVIEHTSFKYQKEFEIKYMLDITGVGSGTLWKEKDLFSTKEEALAECDIRNAIK